MIVGILRPATITAFAVMVAVGCGKKGPPLPPFVRIPAAVQTIAAARAGHQVYVTLTVPAANVDESIPVDIARIEVYGYTGAAPPPMARWPELGTLIATIPVEAPPPPAEGAPAAPAPNAATGAARPGASITVAETLEPDDLVAQAPAGGPGVPTPVATPSRAAATARRYYLAIPFSTRGRPGPPGAQAELVLAAPPDPPTDLRATYDATAVQLAWEPSGGLVGFLLDRQAGAEEPPFDELPAPSGASATGVSAAPAPTVYRVYRTTPPSSTAPTTVTDAWRASPPTPMSADPLAQMAASDAVAFGEERCYAVRAERGGILSDASLPVCLTPIDRFAPATPTGLAAVPSEGAINLIWEPNGDADLAGYLILRRGPGDATLRQLTDRPIAEARYRDAAVEPGTHYTYAVVAVDRQSPVPNVSAPSATVDEVAP